jgi:allantoinase
VGYDLIIRGGAVVTTGGVEPLAIGVADGVIAAVAPELAGGAREELDAAGLHVLPGLVDAHVHFNEPGRTDWEGIATGSAALAAGGGTCFFDMPLNAAPPTLDAASFDLKRAAAEGRAAADFGLWGGLVPGDLDRMDELAERGAVGFKAFLSATGTADFERADDLTLLDGMARAAALGLPVAVHAESEAVTAGLARRARAEGRTGVRDYLKSRPAVAELEAIQRVTLFAEETGCALHVVHVSTGRGVALVAEARRRGVDVTCETCPHYLLLTADDVERLGAAAKCAPPLRDRADVDALWRHVLDGGVHLVASDHSPAPPSMKAAADFFEVWGGIAGCQSTLPILLAEGHGARGLPLPRLAELVAGAPAERFGIAGKGRIEPGYDADLVLVDREARAVLRTEDLLYRHPISPYVGRRLHGLVRRTLVRGRAVFADGAPTGVRPGRLVRPRRNAPPPAG